MILPLQERGSHPQPHSAISHVGSQASQDHGDAMRTYVVNCYQIHRLSSQLWDCRICGRRATDLYHSAISFLFPSGSNSVDMIVPTCKSSRCCSEGFNMAHEFGKYGKPGGDATECENCGSKSRLKLCVGCTFSHTAQSASSWGASHQARQRHRQDSTHHGLEKDEATE
ncbi:hypothetical protein BDZ45DRAFT_801505 [Acephala macrosclerotiorum]|nr:hypothetical protein BDZ45DRAFT_801505 [Acephala macrosclerotiorum]